MKECYAWFEIHSEDYEFLKKSIEDCGIHADAKEKDLHISVCNSRTPFDFENQAFFHETTIKKIKTGGGRPKKLIAFIEDENLDWWEKQMPKETKFNGRKPHITLASGKFEEESILKIRKMLVDTKIRIVYLHTRENLQGERTELKKYQNGQ